MSVYVIKTVGCSPVRYKIGFSSSVKNRKRTFDRQFPFPVEMIMTCRGGEAVERWAHWIYRRWRVHGEWFEFTDSALRRVCSAIRCIANERRNRTHRQRGLPSDEKEAERKERFRIGELIESFYSVESGILPDTPIGRALEVFIRVRINGGSKRNSFDGATLDELSWVADWITVRDGRHDILAGGTILENVKRDLSSLREKAGLPMSPPLRLQCSRQNATIC